MYQYYSNIPKIGPNSKRQFDTPETLEDVFDIAMIRDRQRWTNLTFHMTRSDIQLCPGNKMVKGYTGLDYPEWDAETMPLPFGDECITNILCLHSLDHLSPKSVVRLLAEVQRVLMLDGIFTIVVPHHMSTLAHECLEHKSQYGIKTWRNIFKNPAYDPLDARFVPDWRLKIGFNMIMGIEERNLVLVTQLIKI